jgi:hypothetical protein
VASIATDVLPEATELGLFAGACGVAVALLWPLIGPVTEISKLAGESGCVFLTSGSDSKQLLRANSLIHLHVHNCGLIFSSSASI